MHRFRNLKVYQKSLCFSSGVRRITKLFPREELFVLTAQFRRASDSIVLNIAEGSGNDSPREFGKYLAYAIRSGYECIACIDIAYEEQFITPSQRDSLFETVDEIIAMLNGLKKTILRPMKRTAFPSENLTSDI